MMLRRSWSARLLWLILLENYDDDFEFQGVGSNSATLHTDREQSRPPMEPNHALFHANVDATKRHEH
ncbi:unnamed protein product [Linum trigynum]|uniref:Secreted protein n=1 Tax=Linum trigynum TaxID=586398 RepID=A0AAV2DYX2_9ROSI